MKRDPAWQRARVRHALDTGYDLDHRELEATLRACFMRAHGLTCHRAFMARRAVNMARVPVGVLDHTTYATTKDLAQLAIISQPYGQTSALEMADLAAMFDKGVVKVSVEDLSSWTFYYPGRTGLILVRLPYNYCALLRASKK